MTIEITMPAKPQAKTKKKASKATPNKAAPKKPIAKQKAVAKKALANGKTIKPAKARDGSKQQQLIAMLQTAKGASVSEIAEKFGWQNHTVRGCISGTLRKGLGLNIEAESSDTRGTVYRIGGKA